MTAFARFPARLQEAIVSRLGWTSLRPVQELAGEAILDGKNAIVIAPTAGGKTEAAMFPALANLIEREPDGVGVIYIAPIKALLNNQEERIGTYTEMVGLRRFVWHGDIGDAAKRKFVKEPAEVLMTTPESLEVMLVSPRSPVQRLFKDLRLVVVDEVHALAGTDRGAHLMSVIERLAPSSANDVQRVGLSATVGNPDQILAWLRGSSQREGVVIDPPKKPAKRDLSVGLYTSVAALADEAAARGAGKKSLFFCQSRALTETVAERMRGRSIDVFVHHSSVSLEERKAAEERFAHGTNACIVCTSTLELGIDVGDLDLVFQANAPSTVSSFMQRMGRTGRRAGTTANTAFLCEEPEAVLQAVALIELAREGWIERVAQQERCWPVLVHQLLAMSLQFGAISGERCWEQLSRVPDFRGISRAEFDVVIEHMLKDEFLFESGGLLSMGTAAERAYGKKNFMELYAVFSSPVLYRVVTEAGRDLGSLEQDFVDRLVEQMSSFLLGGRAWTVTRVNHDDRVVVVRDAPGGVKPSWGGFIPQHLGFELCQRIERVLTEDIRYPYVNDAAYKHIVEKRDDLGDLLRRGSAVQLDGGVAHWWTFAGGRINHTLKYGIEVTEGWKVMADNFQLRIEGDGVSHESVRQAIEKMSSPAFWDAPDMRHAVLARLPGYRLSKFQDCLPEKFALEVIENYLLDVPGTLRWLGTGDPVALHEPVDSDVGTGPRISRAKRLDSWHRETAADTGVGLDDVLATERVEPRFLLARVTKPGGTEKLAALARERDYEVQVGVGPRDPTFFVLAQPVAGLPVSDRSERVAVLFTEPTLAPVPEVAWLDLPPTGATATCRFKIRTTATTERLEARIAVLHNGRVLQTGALRGICDGKSLITFTPEATPRVQLAGLDERHHFGVSVIANHTDDGVRGFVAATADGKAARLALSEADVAALIAALGFAFDTVKNDPREVRSLRDESSVSALRDLAAHGAAFHAALVRDNEVGENLLRRDPIQVVNARASAFLPIELAYRWPVPNDDAVLCPHAEEGLASESGDCPSACEGGTEARLCPLGFWSLSRVIERVSYRPRELGGIGDFGLSVEPLRGRSQLHRPRTAVLGASDQAKKRVPSCINDLAARLAATLGIDHLAPVPTWQAWTEAVKGVTTWPPMLVLVPHHDRQKGFELLEIGTNSLKSVQVKPAHVLGDHVSAQDARPIVLLLGCETQLAEISYESFVTAFRASGAAVVVGTIATVLGLDAAPVAAELAQAIVAEYGATPARSLGEVMLRVRRRLVAAGRVMVLALSADGDADWLLS